MVIYDDTQVVTPEVTGGTGGVSGPTVLLPYEDETIFIDRTMNFSKCFYGCNRGQGEAPELWRYDFKQVIKDQCFRGSSSFSNYAEIPDEWK